MTIGVGERLASFYRYKYGEDMQNRYGYFKRVNDVYYALDLQSQRQTSLKTRCEAEANALSLPRTSRQIRPS